MGLTWQEQLEVYVGDRKTVPKGATMESVEEKYAEDVTRFARMSGVAAQIPRRVGFDGSREEMRVDRAVGRVMTMTYLDLWRRLAMFDLLYGRPVPNSDWKTMIKECAENEPARREGATVQWAKWIEERSAIVPQQLAIVARVGLHYAEHRRGGRLCHLLVVEARGLDRAKERMGE
jgi:hypothetical protein